MLYWKNQIYYFINSNSSVINKILFQRSKVNLRFGLGTVTHTAVDINKSVIIIYGKGTVTSVFLDIIITDRSSGSFTIQTVTNENYAYVTISYQIIEFK